MSFITKRERVFNEYDLFDLPARNEGKLKAYASCTDARAWSHFCSDKSEHLVEIIKRNNETVRPKYLPTNVIVDTLMAAKNTEIARLKQKIEEFEQMLAAYDQLDLTCEQKCEIAEAHAAIRAANKELDDMFLDLDLSGFTEALDSEGFETGKSKGDGDENMTQVTGNRDMPLSPTFKEEQPPPKRESNKACQSCHIERNATSDAETLAVDQRVEEMQDIIISKDAKLSAMNNTVAVLESDVCEPYCIYAHIYTALEKIYGILCQNANYRQYLNVMVGGKDFRCIDIKGKILFKLKVLERFSGAIISPCNDEIANNKGKNSECACYRAEMESCLESGFAMTSTEARKPNNDRPNSDSKRAHLVADIIRNEEMKEILSKDNILKEQDSDITDDGCMVNDYNIENENLARLKKLQENYDDLMICYESLKHEKECLQTRCHEYEDLEKEFESLKLQIKEYNSLWNEKEHYRKRSADLDSLKEQYLILTDETANVETQLKAATEINMIKCVTIDELRNENVILEKKMNEALIAFEKEKNSLMCKLKEADCTIMCQGQQIKTLSVQIDRLLDQEQHNFNPRETEHNSIALIDEVESHRDQIKNLKEALFCNEEEKQNLQQQYQDQLQLINDLKNDINEYKSAYEKCLQRNDYLEKYTESLIEETRCLSQDKKEKKQAVENLLEVINKKSQKINELLTEIDSRKSENMELFKQINELKSNFNDSLASSENEKLEAIKSLQLARAESQELLHKVKDYDYVKHLKADVSKSLEMQIENKKELESLLINAVEENHNLKEDLASREKSSSILIQEIQNLREINNFAMNNMNALLGENSQYKTSIELTQKESGDLKQKLKTYENLTPQLQNLQIAHAKLVEENNRLKNELDNAILSIQLTKRESDELIGKLQHSETAKDELLRLKESYQKLGIEKRNVQKELSERNNDIEKLLQSLNNKIHQNEYLLRKCSEIDNLKQELLEFRETYDQLLSEKNHLQKDLNKEKKEIEKLQDMLQKKNEEIKSLEVNELASKNSIKSLQEDNLSTKATLNLINKESAELLDKIKHYEKLEVEFKQLKRAHDQMKTEKEKLQSELDMQLADLKRIEKENFELQCHSQTLITHSEDLENALINSRKEIIDSTTDTNHSYNDILTTIEQMRREKLGNQKKIRDLMDRLDASENIISNLSEDVLARDDRISILENHINNLEEEARRLHTSLAEIIETGEQMKDISFVKIDSIKNMEAHHSKATHNMKMELAKLQQQNATLEDQLSVTKIKSEESSKDINRHQSQITNLKNERDILVTEIKQLELKTVGDSDLVPSNCDIKKVLTSLDRVRKSLDVKISKSASLEQTMFKMQTSSQLLLSKADAAKKIVEKEKQKIVSEKEEAVRDKQVMEQQLLDLKEKLENQIANDKIVIKDLEATILNQKLIINKINQSTKEYIAKLKEELQTLQNLYHNSMSKIGELQENLQNMTEDKSKQMQELEEIKENFNGKCKEVCELQKELDNLKNKQSCNVTTQTKSKDNEKDITTQIEREMLGNKVEIRYDDKNALFEEKNEKINQLDPENINVIDFNKTTHRKHHSESKNKPEEMPVNEVQILTANIEPTFDYVRNSYMNYKITRLSFGRLEKYSISCPSDNDVFDNLVSQSSNKTIDKELNSSTLNNNPNLVDIYNRQSMHSNSSKENYDSENLFSTKESRKKSSVYAEFGTTDVNINNNYIEEKSSNESTPGNLPDKDLFVIYKDGQNTYNNPEQGQGTWSKVVVETVAVYPKKVIRQDDKKSMDRDSFFYPKEEEEKSHVEKARQKLKIKMPVLGNESNSLLTTSEGDKKSLDSYSLSNFVTSKHLSASDTKINDDENCNNIKNSTPSLPALSNEDNLDRDSKYYSSHRELIKPNITETGSGTSKQTFKIINKKSKPTPNSEKESHHKLSRVEANVLLLKSENNIHPTEDTVKQKLRHYGLDYISDNVQDNINPLKANNSSKNMRITKSDEMFHIVKDKEDNPSSSKLDYLKIIPLSEYQNSINSKSSQKTFTEQSIMVKLDKDSDYENKITSLTKALETIEKDYKKKIEAIKVQYDSNIKSIINEHNQGVKSIQSLHEDTLQDIIKIHENEVENLRSMSIEAMRKAEKLEKENRALKTKVQEQESPGLIEYPVKVSAPELRKRPKCRSKDTRLLTKTTVEAFNVKPKPRGQGPCTCSLDVNISDTIRNIFEQVDVEQRKMAEHAYVKYIANKMMNGNIETLDAQELSFLHLKVCRTWRTKLSKEEALQKKIESLESELLNKQRNAQQHFADLDRKVAEEKRRLQEVREAVCRSASGKSRPNESDTGTSVEQPLTDYSLPGTCSCNVETFNVEVNTRGSAGDLILCSPNVRSRRNTNTRNDSNMAVPAIQSVEERREKKLYNDEPPTRLRRSHDRQLRLKK